ncbi:Uncharacterised protein [Mycobacteroides abscessus subsp. abscessus]|nr:Uncharacterised protein [Mycobacteroides abscessus subsp. abscessus]
MPKPETSRPAVNRSCTATSSPARDGMWLYSAATVTPSRTATARIVSLRSPDARSSASAASTMRSRLSTPTDGRPRPRRAVSSLSRSLCIVIDPFLRLYTRPKINYLPVIDGQFTQLEALKNEDLISELVDRGGEVPSIVTHATIGDCLHHGAVRPLPASIREDVS